MVTHKGSVLPLVNRLVVMAAGQIVLDGPRDAVLEHLRKAQSQAAQAAG
jgi:ATP-binding cassette subfamily C protein LapB